MHSEFVVHVVPNTNVPFFVGISPIRTLWEKRRKFRAPNLIKIKEVEKVGVGVEKGVRGRRPAPAGEVEASTWSATHGARW